MNIDKLNNIDRVLLLQTWVRIVEAGNLTSAAKQLNTSQPTVSRRLKSLELMLGCKLLLRTTHQLKLTDDGEACYQHAKVLLGQWTALEETVGKYNSKIQGRLRVRAPHAFGQEQLIEPLVKYLNLHPDMRVDWLLNDSSPDFLADNIDCAIHVGTVTEANVVAKLIAYVPRIVVAAPSLVARYEKAQGINALQEWPWIAISTYYNHQLTLRETQLNQISSLTLEPLLATDNLYSAVQCTKLGLGVAVISSWLAQPLLKSGELIHLVPRWQADPLPIYIVYPYANYYPKRLTSFVTIMKDAIQKMTGTATPK